MAKAWLEDKATWLFDLAHDNLDEDAIVKGFLKHYVLQGRSIGDVQQDLHFRTHYGDFYLESAMADLRRALEVQIYFRGTFPCGYAGVSLPASMSSSLSFLISS